MQRLSPAIRDHAEACPNPRKADTMTDTGSPFGWLPGPRDRIALLAFLADRAGGSAGQQEIVDLGFSVAVVADAIARDEAEIVQGLWGSLVIKEAGRAALLALP